MPYEVNNVPEGIHANGIQILIRYRIRYSIGQAEFIYK